MSTTTAPLERRVTAYYAESGRTDQPDNIHTDLGARKMGYRGGLVYGNQVFGWSTRLLMDFLGEDWLRDGWADLRVVRPCYVGDELTIRVTAGEHGSALLEALGEDGKPRITAAAGRGTGAWVASHVRSRRLNVEPIPDPQPRIFMETAPVGQDLPCLQAKPHDRLATLFAEASAYGYGAFSLHGKPVVSPAEIAGRMTWYVHAVWDYAGPAIHSRSLLQFVDTMSPEDPITVAGHLSRVYEKNGNHYSETDGTILSPDGRTVALARHSSIFKLSPRERQ